MINTKTQIGPWHIKVADAVTKLGLVYDSYKAKHRLELWEEAEMKARHQILPYTLDPMFHEERRVQGKLVYEFRYYTPVENRVRITPGDEVVILDTPEKCRDFVKSLRLGPNGAAITHFTQADGRQISVDEASDDQITRVAAEFAAALNKAGAH